MTFRGPQVLSMGGGPGPGSFDPTSNPFYQQMVSRVNASGAAQAASTRAAIQQALIAFGLVPEGFNDTMGALDDTTKALIEKNTSTGISGYARLLEAKKEGIKDLVNRTTARGLRRSGARGAGLRKNQLGADRQLADSLAALQSQIGGYYGQYAQSEADRQNQLASTLASIYSYYYGSGGGYQPYAPPSSGGGGSSGYGGGGYNWWSPPGDEEDSSGYWGVGH